MRRVALLVLPIVAVAFVVATAVVVRRRRAEEDFAPRPEPEESVRRVDLPEAIGYRVEGLRDVHEHVAAMPRRGPEEAEAESRTRPSGLTLYDEQREEEEAARHGAVQHLSTEPLVPKQV
jgi:hypothetical protein